MTTPEPRVTVIEGRKTLVIDRHPPLPPTLQLLLQGGEGFSPLRVVHRQPLHILGARPECEAQDHRLADWLEGFQTGSDAVVRYLRLLACQDCGSICVRDASYDHLTNLPTGGQQLRRKSHVIAWYSGTRRGQRTYN